MKIYKAAIIGLGPSGLAVNKILYGEKKYDIIAFENTEINNRDNFFGFWMTDWMRPFENLIQKKWHQWQISNRESEINHNDSKNPYCVISYKTWKNYCLDTQNNLEIKNKKVIKYYQKENYFKIITDDQKEYFAEKIYDSRSNKEKNNELIQHFFGINIITENKIFNQKKLTLMHFTDEENLLHFIYILPFSSNSALIESTVFSKRIFSENWYRNKIDKYMKEIGIVNFKEQSSENGVIPMFFSDIKPAINSNIINIGIRGGACKPSTGYVFSFLIRQIQQLKKTNKNNVSVHHFLERKMDKIFLNYLKNNKENGTSFINLAKNLNGREFQTFMMGESSLLTKLKIIKSMPKLPFIKAMLR